MASKGLVSMDIAVDGASTDLHSGRYGGTVANPLHALAEILASLHDRDGTVAVAGFYDGIPELTGERRREIADVPFYVTHYLAELGLTEGHGEAGVHHPGASLGAADARGQWGARRRQVHGDPARRGGQRVLPAGARPGPGPR